MKITRDGKTYELTAQELEQACRERDEYYYALDVELHLEEHLGKVCNIPFEDRVSIGRTAKYILEGMDFHWSLYWDAFEEAINEYLAEYGLTIDDMEDA